MLLPVPHQVLRFGLSAAGKAKFAALPEKNPAHLFAVQVSYCAGSVLLTKMLHFKRAKSAFAALCNVEKRQAVWYNREHADNTRLDFRRASPQSKRMDFNINNRGQMKKGSKNHELLQLANSFVDFSEADIDERTQRIFTSFVDFLSQNMLLE